MDKRYLQANQEARLSLYITLLYLILWTASAYCLGSETDLFGFPMWFEISCVFTPIGFVLICYIVVKYWFKDISLENDQSAPPSNQ